MVPQMSKLCALELDERKNKGDMKNVIALELFKQITGNIVGQLFFGDDFSKHKIDGTPITIYNSNGLN